MNYPKRLRLAGREVKSATGKGIFVDCTGTFMFAAEKKNISAKAFLATEQRIPGLGNASCSDFSNQMIHRHVFPKRGGMERLFDLVVQE